MLDPLVILTVALFAGAIGASIEYYRLIRKAHREYEHAKETIEDIVLSFDRQLKRESNRLELVAYKVEGLGSRTDAVTDKANQIEEKIVTLNAKIASMPESDGGVYIRLDEMERKLRNTVASQEMLTTKITEVEKQAKQLPSAPEMNIEAVIPIKRDRAVAPLTETEIAALEFLASEGPKTAPEIKEKSKLSREHAARLMKKLYDSGYVERSTTGIPFVYSVKTEMEKLLKKTESESV